MHSMCRRTTGKLVLLFTVACLLMVAANEVFALSQCSVIDFCSGEEDVEKLEFDEKQIPSFQAAFNFELACFFYVTDSLCAAPLSHVTHDVQSRGPPTSGL